MSNAQVKEVIALLEGKRTEYEQSLRALEQTIHILRGTSLGSHKLSTSISDLVNLPERTGKRGRPRKFPISETPAVPKVPGKRGRPRLDPTAERPVKGKKLTVNDKLILILRGENRFLHSREIVSTYISRYPEKVDDRDRLARQLSAMLSIMRREGKIVNWQIGNSLKYTFWGFKEWLNEDGNIKPAYMYKIR